MTTNIALKGAEASPSQTLSTSESPSQKLKAAGILAGKRPAASRAEEKDAHQDALEKRYC